MGMSSNNSEGPVANINVTPLVDVMLVLLVIFMVTAPMLQQGVDVNLPKATTAPLAGSDEQVVMSIDKEKKIYVGSKNELLLDEIVKKMPAILDAKKDNARKVYIKADESIDYGFVMKVMGKLHEAGIDQIGLVSAPLD